MSKTGILYLVFGKPARLAAEASIASLQRVNSDLAVAVIGDDEGEKIDGVEYIHWTGENPYKPSMPRQFHFMAGRVKPLLYDLSPFDKTLYVDADTEFQADITAGFTLLDQYDFMLAKHASHNIGMLNQMPGRERLTTIAELGGDGDQPYPNSGVLFWRHSPAAQALFQAWHTEWMRFQEWDEQLALMRALYKHPLRLLLLPESWNGENRREGSIIFHDFHGRQVARSNIELPPETGTLPDIAKVPNTSRHALAGH